VPYGTTLVTALRLSAAARPFEEALGRDGKDAAALGGLGAVLAEQGPSEDARDLLGRARKLDEKRPAGERKRTRRLLAAAEVARGRKSEALALLTEALALKPADPAEDQAAAEAGTALSDR
jgi:Flp pilus assembly protein TadD